MEFPDGLLYTQDHEWALKRENVVVVGITDYAQDQLGDIVYLDLPKIGTKIQKGNTFGAVESVKAVSDLYAPVSGEIVKINEALKQSLHHINSDPYHQGWIIEIKLSNPDEIKDLLDQAQYKKLVS